jgi:MYXO-CTERM domain-containing protein
MKPSFALTVLLSLVAATSYSQSTQPSTQPSYDSRAANETTTPNHDPLRNFGWIGLIGLAGLAGLAGRRKATHSHREESLAGNSLNERNPAVQVGR